MVAQRDPIGAAILRFVQLDASRRRELPDPGSPPSWRGFLARHGSLPDADAVELIERASLEAPDEPIRAAAESFLADRGEPYLWTATTPSAARARPVYSLLGLPRRSAVLTVEPASNRLATGDDDWSPMWTLWSIDARVARPTATPYEGPLRSLARLPDGRWVTGAADDDPRVIVWTDEGVAVAELGDPEGRFGRIAVLDDGSLLVCDGALARWRVGDTAPMWSVARDREGDPIEWFAIAANRRTVLVPLDTDWSFPSVSTCALLDLDTGEPVRHCRLDTPLRFRGAAPCIVGDRVYGAATTRAALIAIDLGDGRTRAIRELTQHPAVLVGHDGLGRVALGSADGTISLLDGKSLELVARWPAHDGRVTAATFVSDGAAIWTTGADRRVHGWSTQPEPPITARELDDLRLDPVALAGSVAVGGAPDGSWWIADLRARAIDCLAEATRHSHAALPAVVAAPKHDIVALVDAPGPAQPRAPVRVRIVGVAARRIMDEIEIGVTDADLGFGPHGGRFALESGRGWLVQLGVFAPRLWSLLDGVEGPQLHAPAPASPLRAIVAALDGSILACGSEGALHRWRAPEARPETWAADEGDAPADRVCLALDPLGRRAAWSARDGAIVVVDVATGQRLRVQGCTGVTALAFLDDHLIAGYDDGRLHIHDPTDARCLARWRNDAAWSSVHRTGPLELAAVDRWGRILELELRLPAGAAQQPSFGE